MRKMNSELKVSYVSETGGELINRDYFAFVELNDYACYVLASGISGEMTAQEVVEDLILSFEEKSTLSKAPLKRYMDDTNEKLLSSRDKQEASVVMLVTDYEKFRYVTAGNVRLRMYRSGRFFLQSDDMSLAADMLAKGDKTPLDQHEERHNLYTYLGKRNNFRPYVSETQTLNDADIILLYSRGLWENVDSGEIDDVIIDATDDPQPTIDTLEELLLSRQPEDLASYTATAIFVNKAFRDPERERKRQRYIKIAIITFILLVVLVLVIWIINWWHNRKVENLAMTRQQLEEYVKTGNFERAQSVCQQALQQAKDLYSKDDILELQVEQTQLDNLVAADNFMHAKDYYSAFDSYKNALKGADSYAAAYIQKRLDLLETTFDTEEFMKLGDKAFKEEDYDLAAGMYLKAAAKSEAMHDTEAHDKAFASLEKVYDKRAEMQKAAKGALDEKKKLAVNDVMKKADTLLASGDLEGAQQAYLKARNISDDPAVREQTSTGLGRIVDERDKQAANERIEAENRRVQAEKEAEARQKKDAEAVALVKAGDEAFDAGDWLTAQMSYMRAVETYIALEDKETAAIIGKKYDIAVEKSIQSKEATQTAENIEMRAREAYSAKKYVEARALATQAQEKYKELAMKTKEDEMNILLQQISADEVIGASSQ